MQQSRSFLRVFAPLAILGASACAGMAPPARTAGAIHSPDGVELAVTGLSCDQVREPEHYGDDLAELTVAVAVRNGTANPVAVRPDDLRLVLPGGSELETVTWGAARPLAVDRGETKSFEVRFMDRGALACGEELQLDTRGSVTASGQAVDTGRLRFVAEAAR